MRTEKELIEHLTAESVDQWALSELVHQLKPIAQHLVSQALHARQNGAAASQPNVAHLLSRMAQIVADVFCNEGVHECDECGVVGCEDEMHDHSTTYRDRWLCDDCQPIDWNDSDHAYDAMVDHELEAVC